MLVVRDGALDECLVGFVEVRVIVVALVFVTRGPHCGFLFVPLTVGFLLPVR